MNSDKANPRKKPCARAQILYKSNLNIHKQSNLLNNITTYKTASSMHDFDIGSWH